MEEIHESRFLKLPTKDTILSSPQSTLKCPVSFFRPLWYCIYSWKISFPIQLQPIRLVSEVLPASDPLLSPSALHFLAEAGLLRLPRLLIIHASPQLRSATDGVQVRRIYYLSYHTAESPLHKLYIWPVGHAEKRKGKGNNTLQGFSIFFA